MGAKVLMFQVAMEKRIPLVKLCGELGIEAVTVDRKNYGQPLGVLAGITGFSERMNGDSGKKNRAAGAEMMRAMMGEMLVFSGMPEETLDQFLAAYKKAGIAPVALKAVLTPHNIRWTPEELFQELFKEHWSLH